MNYCEFNSNVSQISTKVVMPYLIPLQNRNKVLIEMEVERKKEFERRRKLRLLQVREQSKDFANKLRENIQAETIHQRKALLALKKKELKKQQEEELNLLKELYKTCLQTVGESHREAAKQPDINLIKQAESVQMSEKAAVRGDIAKKQHLVREAKERQKFEAPIKQKRMIRNRENLRSFYISSLPKHTTVPENHSICEKSPKKHSEHRKGDNVLKEVPSNLLSINSAKTHTTVNDTNLNEEFEDKNKRQKFKGNSQCNKILDEDKFLNIEEFEDQSKRLKFKENHQCYKISEEDKFSITASSKECACDFICCCHNSPRELKRRCHSEPRASSESNSELEVEIKKGKLRSRSCSPRSVRTLNYCDTKNLYESNQPNFARVTHHPISSKAKKEVPIAYSVKTLSPEKNLVDKELKKKTEERSSKALQKEKLKRDFEQLLRDLGNITREKAVIKSRRKSKVGVYQRERDILARNQTKQRKLADAFETIIHSEKPCRSQDKGSLPQPQQSEIDESSPSVLNLALYQQITMSSRGSSPQQPTMTRRIISSEEITISQTSLSGGGRSSRSRPRITSPPPPPKSHSPTSPKRLPYPSPPSTRRERDQAEVRQSPEVSVRTEPSGDIHLKVTLAKPLEHKKKCQRAKPLPTLDSSTSYFSPPENLSPSQKQLLDALLNQVNKKALNRDLKDYIRKLLAMSRESIDDLDVSSCSDRIDPVRSPKSPTKKELQDDMAKLSDLTDLYADKVNTLVDMFEQFERFESPEQYFTPPQFIEPEPSPRLQYEVPRVPPPSRLPTPIRQPTPPPPQPTQAPPRRMPQQPVRQKPVRRRTPSPVQRVPRKPTTPPMQRRTKRPQTPRPPIPPVRQVGPPPDSAGSRIPMSPRYQSPERRGLSPTPQPQRQTTPGPSGIQTPFGLASNLMPRPQDVFGGPPVDFGTPQSPPQTFGLSPQATDTSVGSWDPFEGLPTPPPIDPTKKPRDVMSIIREYNPLATTIQYDPSYDLQADLERRGLAHLFERKSPEEFSKKQIPAEPRESGEFSDHQLDSSVESQDDIGEEDIFESGRVRSRASPLTLDNIRERLSDVCVDHYKRLGELLDKETDEDKERLIKEIWGSDSDVKLSTPKSLELIQALRSDS